jgi:hypothetical protein
VWPYVATAVMPGAISTSPSARRQSIRWSSKSMRHRACGSGASSRGRARARGAAVDRGVLGEPRRPPACVVVQVLRPTATTSRGRSPDVLEGPLHCVPLVAHELVLDVHVGHAPSQLLVEEDRRVEARVEQEPAAVDLEQDAAPAPGSRTSAGAPCTEMLLGGAPTEREGHTRARLSASRRRPHGRHPRRAGFMPFRSGDTTVDRLLSRSHAAVPRPPPPGGRRTTPGRRGEADRRVCRRRRRRRARSARTGRGG